MRNGFDPLVALLTSPKADRHDLFDITEGDVDDVCQSWFSDSIFSVRLISGKIGSRVCPNSLNGDSE
jgi:hypothetical protein